MIHKQMEEAERELPAIQQQVPILNSAQQAMEEKLSQISLQENEVEKQIRAVTQQAIKSLQESEKKTIELLKLEVNRKSTILSEQIKEVASDRQQLEEFQKLLKEEVTAEAMTEMQQKLELVRSVIKSTSSLQPVCYHAAVNLVMSMPLMSHLKYKPLERAKSLLWHKKPLLLSLNPLLHFPFLSVCFPAM